MKSLIFLGQGCWVCVYRCAQFHVRLPTGAELGIVAECSTKDYIVDFSPRIHCKQSSVDEDIAAKSMKDLNLGGLGSNFCLY